MTDDPAPPSKRVRRGEGEVTQWPRGLVDYVPTGTPDAVPDPEEDRTRNRIRLAARLIGLLAGRGEEMAAELGSLAAAERSLGAGDEPDARRRVEALLGELERRAERPPSRAPRVPIEP